MSLKDLAPWIAIAVTLILSILVPLFTQIANNRFQIKMKKMDIKNKESEKIMEAYEACVSWSIEKQDTVRNLFAA